MQLTNEQINKLTTLVKADISYHEKQQDIHVDNDEIWQEHEREIHNLLEILGVLNDRGR